MNISILKLYLTFVKIGAILLGGGYVILPILTEEISKKQKLVSEEDIITYFAISQSLPGIVAANISMLVGYKIKGIIGATTAMLGIITAPVIIITCISSIISLSENNLMIKHAFWGIGFGVILLISLTVKEMWEKSVRNLFFYIIFIISLILLIILKISPIATILIITPFGVICKYILDKKGGLE